MDNSNSNEQNNMNRNFDVFGGSTPETESRKMEADKLESGSGSTDRAETSQETRYTQTEEQGMDSVNSKPAENSVNNGYTQAGDLDTGSRYSRTGDQGMDNSYTQSGYLQEGSQRMGGFTSADVKQMGGSYRNTGAQQMSGSYRNTGAQQMSGSYRNTGAQQMSGSYGNAGTQHMNSSYGSTGAQRMNSSYGNTGAQHMYNGYGTAGTQHVNGSFTSGDQRINNFTSTESTGYNGGSQTPPVKNKKHTEKKAAKKKSNNGFGRKLAWMACAGAVFGILAGATFQGVKYGSDKLFAKNGVITESTTADNSDTEASTDNSADNSTIAKTSTTTDTVYDVTTVSKNVMPSIVSISGTYMNTYQSWFNTYQQETEGAGSGIIISQDDSSLLILTNYHVVKNSTSLSVGFVDGEAVDATVKGYDEDNDVAVVSVPLDQIKDSTKSNIKAITMGSSDSLEVGTPCVAIGNALGYGQSVTVGYVSAVDREISISDGSTVKVIQTDAAINPGNSGGALVNMKGELIGMNTAKSVDSQVEGMGYALPISDISDIIQDIIKNGTNASTSTSSSAYLGITAQTVTDEYTKGFGMPSGVNITAVSSGSPAEKCGLQTGDIIYEFNGKTVTDITELQKMIAKLQPGDTVKIGYYRYNSGSYEQMSVDAVLEAKN